MDFNVQHRTGGGTSDHALFEDISTPAPPEPRNRAPQQQQQQQTSPAAQFQQFQQYGQYINDPNVQNMAMQYGSSLATSGKAYVEQNIDRYIPVSRVKFYFAVTTDYVLHKLFRLLVPFLNREWATYGSSSGEPSRHLNSPDLYIPLMAFATYVMAIAVALGNMGRFNPEMLGITATTAFVWFLIEIGAIQLAMYLISVTTDIQIFDLASFSGYKFVHVIVCVLASILLGPTGYYTALAYTSAAIVYFLTCTLRSLILPVSGEDRIARGSKRRNNLLLVIALIQPLIIFWLTHHVTYGPHETPAKRGRL